MADQIITVQVYLTPEYLGEKESFKRFMEATSLKHKIWADFDSDYAREFLPYQTVGQKPIDEDSIVCFITDSPADTECNRVVNGIGIDYTDITHFISDENCGLLDFEAFLVEVNAHPATKQIYVYSDDTHGYPGDRYDRTMEAENFCKTILKIPYRDEFPMGKFTIIPKK